MILASRKATKRRCQKSLTIISWLTAKNMRLKRAFQLANVADGRRCWFRFIWNCHFAWIGCVVVYTHHYSTRLCSENKSLKNEETRTRTKFFRVSMAGRKIGRKFSQASRWPEKILLMSIQNRHTVSDVKTQDWFVFS